MHNFKNLSRVLLGLLLLSLCALSWAQSSNNKPHVAVLNLEGREGVAETQAATLSDRLRGHLVNTRAFVVLDRANMEAVLSEHGFQQTGCSSTQCAVQIGKILNVQKMITGSIGKVGKTYAINLVIINVESSRIERSFNRDYRGEIDGLLQELRTLAQEMAAALGKPAPVP
ncbi:MAG: CsgG/HfaB family protein, partial [candidate division KSB1 bacterium]